MIKQGVCFLCETRADYRPSLKIHLEYDRIYKHRGYQGRGTSTKRGDGRKHFVCAICRELNEQ